MRNRAARKPSRITAKNGTITERVSMRTSCLDRLRYTASQERYRHRGGQGAYAHSSIHGSVHDVVAPRRPVQVRLRQLPPIPASSPALDATEAFSDRHPLSCSTAKAISSSLPRPSSPPSRLVGTSVWYVPSSWVSVFACRLNPVSGARTDPRPLVDACTTRSSSA